MTRRSLAIIPLAMLCLYTAAFADTRNIALTFDQDSLVFSQVVDGLDTFDVVEYRGYIFTTLIGEPQLPQGNIHVLVDTGAVIIDSVVVTYFDTDTLPGKYYLWPVQPPDSTPGTGPEIDFTKPDPRVYGSTAAYPEDLLDYAHQGYLAGTCLAGMLAHPLQYLPDDSLLIFHNSVDFTVYYHQGGVAPALFAWRSDLIKWLIEWLLSKLVINPGDMVPDPRYAGEFDYVIITNETLSPNFQKLIEWKTKKGVNAFIKTTNEIIVEYTGDDDQEKIRNYIIDAYRAGVSWFLLGGDVSVIPERECHLDIFGLSVDIPCDLYYSDLDGDWDGDGDGVYGEPDDGVDMYPDVFVGRAPVETAAEVNVFVNKVVDYERWPPLTDYPLEMLMMGFDLDTRTFSEETKDYIDTHCVPARFDPITKRYEGVTKQSCLDALDDGHNLVNHSGHCNYSVMGTSGGNLTLTDVDNLVNGDRQSVLYSVGCMAAGFDWSGGDCIAEHFLQNAGGGAVAFVGNSRYGLYTSGENPWISRSAAYDISYFKSLLAHRVVHSGQTLARSKTEYVITAGSDDAYRFTMYALNLLGDPEMPIWTDDFNTFDVTEQTLQVPVGVGTSFQIAVDDQGGSPVNDAFVCLSGCGVYETGFTNGSGQFSRTVNPTGYGHISVTITKPDFLPYVSYSKACNGYEDVIIRDCVGDDGRMPSWDVNHNDKYEYGDPDRGYWNSPDILIDNDLDGIPGEPGEDSPVPGKINHVYAYVKNIGTAAATAVTVEFWWADYGLGSPVWGEDFHLIGSYVIPYLGVGETDTAHWVTWDVSLGQPRHTCIWVTIYCATDPIVRHNAGWENNIGWRNYAIETLTETGGGDYEVVVDFKVCNPDSVHGHDVCFGLHLEDWPGWSLEVSSADPDFTQLGSTEFLFASVDPGERKDAQLTVTAAAGTENDSGIVHLAGTIEGEPIVGASLEILPPSITGVDDSHPQGKIPAVSSLAQNYPNPFNPVTQIKYQLARDCHVRLEVFNILGQKVAILVDERQEAGYKTISWNAGSLSSGIYFYRLRAGDFRQTRKMVLLK
ncbi:MAG: T9SS type A sorting domain-containing protein [Candidatus Krumholzibacteriota bacterium]|nr:T9SS type A sorting domain-containing protein [Candidatus Krumholzibacteriota bacterium]